jgi:DNA replication and repair protein RecF
VYLSRLQVTNFKNYTEADISFSEKINCFVGNNGEGKTNLLDAVYYLSFTKSYFGNVDSQNIRHGEDFFAIHGTFVRNGSAPDVVSCILKAGQKKQFRLNKKEYERLSDHIGLFPCVMISPYDRDLINEGSDIRRKFIDMVISQFDKVYLGNLIRYNRLLEQRNALLRRFAESRFVDHDMLSLIDEQMSTPATAISKKRQEFISDFQPIFSHYFGFISSNREEVGIRYESQLLQDSFPEMVKQSLEKDIALRFSTAGIHKDELMFEIGGYPVKRFGSQGQQKSFVVALRLAQYDFTRARLGYKPVLLFDDIFDKLDPSRVEQLIKLTGEDSFGQVFITDTEPERIRRIFDTLHIGHKVFRITGGLAEEITK